MNDKILNIGFFIFFIMIGINGFIVKGKDIVNELVDLARNVIREVDKVEYCKKAVPYAKKNDWKVISSRYYNEIYSKLIW